MIWPIDRIAALFAQLTHAFANSLAYAATVGAQLTPEHLFWLGLAAIVGISPFLALAYRAYTARRTRRAEAAATRTAQLLTHEVIPFLTAYQTLLTQQLPTRYSSAMQQALERQLIAFVDLVRDLTGRDLLNRTRMITVHDLYAAVQSLTLSPTAMPHASAEAIHRRIDVWKTTVLTQGGLSGPTRVTFKTRGLEAFLEALAQDLTHALRTPPLPSQEQVPSRSQARRSPQGARRRRRRK
jgi:hypothetical protein